MYSLIFFTLIASMVLSFALSPLFIHLLYRLSIVRKISTDFSTLVGDRSLKAGTPIMGGLLVVLVTIGLTLVFASASSDVRIILMVFAATALVGGIDDILNIYGKTRKVRTTSRQLLLARVHKDPWHRLFYYISLPWNFYMNIWYELGSYPGSGLQAGEKILLQCAIAGFASWWAYAIKGLYFIAIPFLGTVDIGIWLPVLAVITIISMSNAVNISDGMDGLSAGLLIFAFMALFFIAVLERDWTYATIHAIVIGSLLSYLYFNVKPARVQMGDVGSLSLGVLLAVTAIFQGKIVLLPIIGVIFVAEAASSLIQGIYRRFFGRRLLKMAPLHLHFQIKGWSEEKVVMRFWIFGLVAAFVGIWLNFV